MENEDTELSALEKELADKFRSALETQDFQFIKSVSEEILKKTEFKNSYYHNIGNCYLALNQKDKAVEAYEKALTYRSDKYAINDEFKEIVIKELLNTRFNMILEEAKFKDDNFKNISFKDKVFKEKIKQLDISLRKDDQRSDIYLLRGLCKENLGNDTGATLDYDQALRKGIPGSFRKELQQKIIEYANIFIRPPRPTTLAVNEIGDLPNAPESEVKSRKEFEERWENICKLQKNIVEWSMDNPELADLRTETLEFYDNIDNTKYKSYSFIYNGKFMGIIERKDIIQIAKANPNFKPDSVTFKVQDNNGNEKIFALNLMQRVIRRERPCSDSRKQELERKKRYYYRHKAKLLAYQHEYYENHRVQIHFKNEYYYKLDHPISQKYNLEIPVENQKNHLHFLNFQESKNTD